MPLHTIMNQCLYWLHTHVHTNVHYCLIEPLGANEKSGLGMRLVVVEREVKTKSLVQNNTLVPLWSEDPRYQLAASSDAGNCCCSFKSWRKFTLSRSSLLCVAHCSVCNQDQNGTKQSTSILLTSQWINVFELQKITDQQTNELWHPFSIFNHC